MEFNFPHKTGTGIAKFLPNVSKECLDILNCMLTYDPDKRISASDALRHSYFRDLWEQEQAKDYDSSLLLF